jgi:hypothetical protein
MGLYSATINPNVEPAKAQGTKKAEEDIALRKNKPQAKKKRIRKKGESQREGKDGKLRLEGESRNTATIPVDERSSTDE